RGRREFAERLNQIVRRIRQSPDAEELGAVITDAASAFAGGAAWLRVEGGSARGERIRGVVEEASERFRGMEIPLSEAAALKMSSAWDRLSPDEQQIHFRAQRFARVQAAEMRLFEPDTVQNGRSSRNLYDLLREPIDRARETFRQRFFAHCPTMVDYLHLELVQTLANDDPEALGKDYPGPMV